MTDANPAVRTAYVLVHGAWHNALHWQVLATRLVEGGGIVVPVDLPGHGLNAAFPSSYFIGDERLAGDVSPHAHLTLEDYVATVVGAIEAIDKDTRIVLVGHSMSGLVVTRVADQLADRIARVVYITAYVPVLLPNSLAYIGLPENAGSRGGVYVGDPQATGAIRLNPRSGNADYLEELRATFYNDLEFEQFFPYLNAMTPDLSLASVLGDARGTAEGWGRVPRSFVRCTLDQALPLPLQDRMIREADEVYPDNRFVVHTLTSGHSPFASKPLELAEILLRS